MTRRFIWSSLKKSPAVLLALSVNACTSFGPVGVDPSNRNFVGLNAILRDLPAGGTLDIFLVHGMRADSPQLYSAEISHVSKGLGLHEVPSNDKPAPLVNVAPTVTLDGVSAFGAQNWPMFQPRVSIVRYVTAGDNKHVNFYGFEYWQALAYLKCTFVVAPDTRVVGNSNRSTFCARAPYSAAPGHRLSSSSDLGNRLLKTEIMEWGLADATIATSGYRAVLHEAVQEMLTEVAREIRTGR